MSGKLMDRLFLRALISAFGFRPYDKSPDAFIPYFQYKIGPYAPDFYLYFLKPPAWNHYRYELFDKLNVYHGSDISRYLDFHFTAYPDKRAFLRFLRFEAEGQVKRMGKRMSTYRAKLELILSWVAEQEELLKPAANSGSPVVLQTTEEEIKDLFQSFSGHIVVHSDQHLERFMQLLYLLKDLKAPGKNPQLLFPQFSATDMAAILRQLDAFREMKLNTIQKRIAEAAKELRPDDPRTRQLLVALTDFFYGQAVR